MVRGQLLKEGYKVQLMLIYQISLVSVLIPFKLTCFTLALLNYIVKIFLSPRPS